MNIWLDIDNSEHIPFYKLLTSELQRRGHMVIVTAVDEKKVKETLEISKFYAEVIGKVISIFGFLEDQSKIWRSTKLYDYLVSKRVDVAFSHGSTLISSYNCAYLKIPLILFLNDINKKINWSYLYNLNVSFIVQNPFIEKLLIEHGIAKKKITVCKSFQKIDPSDSRSIEEICIYMESFFHSRDVKA